MKLATATLLLIVCGCRTGRDAPLQSALNALCVVTKAELPLDEAAARLHLVVRSETEPLLNEVTLLALHARAGTAEVLDLSLERRLLSAYRTQHQPERVTLPLPGGCSWQLKNKPDDNEVFVQVSSPFENPYSPGEIGRLTRVSLGAQSGASWFWLKLEAASGLPEVSGVVPLDIADY